MIVYVLRGGFVFDIGFDLLDLRIVVFGFSLFRLFGLDFVEIGLRIGRFVVLCGLLIF